MNKQDWYFTFKKGASNFGHYLKLCGTKEETMAKAISKYGNDINFQYDFDMFKCGNECWELKELKEE
jgi:hypothetical protein